MDLAPDQKTLAADIITLLTKATEETIAPPPACNAPTVTAYDAYVAPGERIARIPIALSEPANQTMVVRFMTQNDTAIENFQFVRAEGYLTFHPGEQVKVVPVTLKGELGSKRLKLILGWPQNEPAARIVRPTALISGDKTLIATFAVGGALPKPSGLMQRPALDLVFQETFGASFDASDSGLKADGTPCWKTRLIHGRTQAGNKEIGYYADTSINPGTAPIVRDANGKLALQSQYLPDGVKDANGNLILCPWDVLNGVQQPFKYTASLISTEKNMATINVGTYVEARLTMPLEQGSWPALWIIAADDSWPSLEFDLFEGFFSATGNLAQLGTTAHWKDAAAPDGHAKFSLRLPHLGIDLTQPHTWGVYWGADEVTFFVDDVPYMAVPNLFPAKDSFLMLNIAVGGLVAKPADPASYGALMPIDWVKVWQ